METLWHIREAALKLTVLTLSIRTFPRAIIEFSFISPIPLKISIGTQRLKHIHLLPKVTYIRTGESS